MKLVKVEKIRQDTVSGGVDLATIKADSEIAGAITHSQSAHAPSNAQKNSDITKAEIEAKLTGEISTHTHAGGGGGLSQAQVLIRNLGC